MSGTMNRRGFLKGAATAASFTMLAGASVRGTAANSRVRAGVVGLGGRGRMIAGMLADHGGYEITALADYFPDVAGKAGRNFGVPETRCFSGLNGCLRLLETDVEAVFLETPPYCFPGHVEAAVAAGRHVFMAKPVACDVPGTLRVQAAAVRAKAGGRVFLIDFQTRTDPLIIEGIERVHRGEIGELGLLCSQYTDEAFADPPLTGNAESRLQRLVWVNDIALGGGYLVNAGIHAIDVALWIARGVPTSACGASRIVRSEPHGDSHDVFSLTYEFESGLLLNHRGEHLRNRHEFHCDCLAHGRDGHLETAYAGSVAMPAIRGGWGGGEVKNLYADGAKRNIAWFHECVTQGNTDNPTVAPGIEANLAVILGREAAALRARVTRDEILADNRVIEPDLSGLRE